MTIQSKPATPEYRDGWDRVFGRKPRLERSFSNLRWPSRMRVTLTPEEWRQLYEGEWPVEPVVATDAVMDAMRHGSAFTKLSYEHDKVSGGYKVVSEDVKVADMRIGAPDDGKPIEPIFWIAPNGDRYECLSWDRYRAADGSLWTQDDILKKYGAG